MKENIKAGIKSIIGIIFGLLIFCMVINLILLYPAVGAISIFVAIASIYLYLTLANKIGKDIKENRNGSVK